LGAIFGANGKMDRGNGILSNFHDCPNAKVKFALILGQAAKQFKKKKPSV
jgi:hypothetical protein